MYVFKCAVRKQEVYVELLSFSEEMCEVKIENKLSRD